MNHDQFTYWLQGFVEMNGGKEPTKEQWKMIKDHLQLCFVKGGVNIPQAQYRYPENMQPWLTPIIRGGYGGQGGSLGSDADKYVQYSVGGAGWPIDKYGRPLTNAEIEQRKTKGGGGGC